MKNVVKIVAITIITVLMLLTCSGCHSSPPKIQSGEFPFVIEYEYEGKIHIIEDTVVCSYGGVTSDAGIPTRWYASKLKHNSDVRILTFEKNAESFLVEGKINEASYITLDYGYGGYYLGDRLYKDSGPCFSYVEMQVSPPGDGSTKYTSLSKKEIEKLFDIKIIRFEFSKPIKNTFE